MLSPHAIVEALGEQAPRFDLEYVEVCPSTNDLLLAKAQAGARAGSVVIAARQTAGRGRRGRRWFASPGASLTFSLLWHLPPRRSPAGLSLAVGVALAQALEEAGETDILLKWPNDLLRAGRKIGGILIELCGNRPLSAVIGVGLNLASTAACPAEIAATAGTLEKPHEPNRLLAHLLIALACAGERFERQGFSAFHAEFARRHAFTHRPIKVVSDDGSARIGLCRGVDEEGALLLEENGVLVRFFAGDVSLRSL
ncbi:MAG: biotin--[acetyl-CoA-carboxylase] ligase [Rhodocyclaceae bacterium]|nr:biotin--[acetyl-CoA-carboxylase] ligase [Rhodocyclaceae bacterium]